MLFSTWSDASCTRSQSPSLPGTVADARRPFAVADEQRSSPGPASSGTSRTTTRFTRPVAGTSSSTGSQPTTWANPTPASWARSRSSPSSTATTTPTRRGLPASRDHREPHDRPGQAEPDAAREAVSGRRCVAPLSVWFRSEPASGGAQVSVRVRAYHVLMDFRPVRDAYSSRSEHPLNLAGPRVWRSSPYVGVSAALDLLTVELVSSPRGRAAAAVERLGEDAGQGEGGPQGQHRARAEA